MPRLSPLRINKMATIRIKYGITFFTTLLKPVPVMVGI